MVGARGFLGGHIVAGLRRCGYRVLQGMRLPHPGSAEERHCDLVAMTSPEHWRDALMGVDAVVNAAGILRESGAQTFDAVHLCGPMALAQACIENGVRRFVQISVLGNPQDGEFIASKHCFDAALLALPLNAVVLRPSVVYAAGGSYGGSSLLRALAALPPGVWLPDDGRWLLQPLAAQDLGEIMVRAIDADATGVFDIGGPAPISLRDYQRQWRRWLRIPGTRILRVPQSLISPLIRVAEHLGSGPMGATMWRMLRRGNVTKPEAMRRLVEAFGFAPRALDEVLSLHPSQVQDRWHARLYFLAPLLRATLIALWVISAFAGFLSSNTQIEEMTGPRMTAPFAIALARAAGGLDLAFAIWLASGWRMRGALEAMAASVVIYTIVLGLWFPAVWLAPLGGLTKNLVILPAIAVLWVLSERR